MISELEVRRQSGLSASDFTRVPAGGQRLLHIGYAALVGICATLLLALFLVPTFRWLLLLSCCLVVAAILVYEHTPPLGGLLLTGAVGSLLWALVRIATAPGGIAWIHAISGLGAGLLGYAGIRLWRKARRQQLKLDTLERLTAEVARHNRLVQTFQASQELAQAQGSAPDARQQLQTIQTIDAIRRDILRAIKVDCVIRSNHDVIRDVELHRAEIVPIVTEHFDARADHCSQVLAEALDMHTSVQREFASLGHDSE